MDAEKTPPMNKRLGIALFLRREDAKIAFDEAKRHPWLCSGLDSSITQAMLAAPPVWLPKTGDRWDSPEGSYFVLRREALQSKTLWPWLLCALERSDDTAGAEGPISLGEQAFFSRRVFIYCSLLCWKAGRARACVDELGHSLRLISAGELANAFAITPKSAPKLAGYRLAKAERNPCIYPDPIRASHAEDASQ